MARAFTRLLSSWLVLCPLRFLLRVLDFQAFMPHVQPKRPQQAHIDVCNPHQRQPRKEISAPARHQQWKACQCKKERRDVVAQAIFTGEQVKKPPLVQTVRDFSLLRSRYSLAASTTVLRCEPTGLLDGVRSPLVQLLVQQWDPRKTSEVAEFLDLSWRLGFGTIAPVGIDR
jgi:hypothetical protein